MNLLKYFYRCRRRKGFTLTELVVVVAVIALLMACVVAFAGPVRMMISNTGAKDDALRINNIIGDYIERKLSYANYIDIYAGYSYDTSDTALKNSFKVLQDRYKLNSTHNQKNNPGILIFRFEADSTNSLNNTFKVYDIPVKSATGNLPSSLSANDVVYIDEFYGGYEYFITTDDQTIQTNNLKKRAYLSFRIDSFDFNGEYINHGFSAADVSNYYAFVDPSVTSVTTDPFTTYSDERTGSELVSFALENINVETNSVDDDGDGVVDRLEASTPGVSLVRGKSSGSTVSYGTDVIIFYNIRTYNIKTDTN